MAEACRSNISNWRRGTGANAALLRDRFLQVPVTNKEKETTIDTEKDHPTARRELFLEMQKSLKNSFDLYQKAFERYRNSIHSIKKPKKEGEFKTVDREEVLDRKDDYSRLVIGLGGENVLETGIALHHTYGTPIIPGTALKGLASHYCDRVWGWGADNSEFKRDGLYHKTIFGSMADSTEKDSGHIIFHDAWITPKSIEGSLQLDVMTPHHSSYYFDEKGETAPTDFDDPKPITFLSIVGTFHIAVSCDVDGERDQDGKTEGEKWANLTFDLLTDALKNWGIGGKTNAGYGRLRITANGGSIKEETSEATLTAMEISPELASSPNIEEISSSGTQTTAGVEGRLNTIGPPTRLDAMKPNHNKGDKLEAVREVDPKGWNRLYFKADDGFGGFVRPVKGEKLSSWEIGQKVLLEVAGISGDVYDFVIPGPREKSMRKMKERRR